MDAIDYEKQGFIKGASARINNSGYSVILVSNPRLDVNDNKIKVWVAMEFDTHVKYLAELNDLVLL